MADYRVFPIKDACAKLSWRMNIPMSMAIEYNSASMVSLLK